jgi:PAS domain S-box-containing protein
VTPDPAKLGSSSDGSNLGRFRVFPLLIAFVVVTGSVVAALLLYLRAESIASAEKVLTAFAQLTEEQTTRTLQSVDQTLEIAEARIAAADRAGSASQASIQAVFAAILADHPFLAGMWVLDGQGRSIYNSAAGLVGSDFSTRDYFLYQKEHRGPDFHLGVPVVSQKNGGWIIPASRAWRRPDGEIDRIVVAALDPLYFDHVWTVNELTEERATALWRNDGAALIRSPFDAHTIGASLSDGPVMTHINSGIGMGTLQTVSLIDGQDRLVAYRRLATYPTLGLSVTQSMNRVLAGWLRIAWIMISGWAIAMLALAGLAFSLARQWGRRHAMEHSYRTLFDASPFPMLVADPETSRFWAVNQASVEQYGWSREELLEMTIYDLHLPEDSARATSLRERQYVPGDTRLVQGLRDRTKDGRVIDVEASVRLIDFEGRVALLAVVQNVTARKAAEKRLAQVESLYQMLFKASPHPMAALDGETWRFLAVSDSALEQYGWSREELLGMSPDDLYSPEDRRKIIAWRQGLHLNTSNSIGGIRHRRKDGTFFDVELIMRAITIDGRPGFLAAIEDVTARLAGERARLIAEDQQRQGQKMETVGQLTGGIAHDFNNILMVILANTDELLEDGSLSAETKDRLGHIDTAVQRASTLTRQLLAFSRKQPLKPQQTDLNDLVTETGTLLQRALGAQIEIESILSDDLCVANIDRSQMQTALVNLSLNARDAMPRGGKLLIETYTAIVDESYVALHPDAVEGTYAVIAVTDTGDGIAPKTLAKVFEPFFTTKEVGKGTGLGLSMVYGFIKQSNGHVRIYSEVDHGTSVKLYLPCSGKTAEMALSRDNAPISRGSERVLVVEDEAQVRASVLQQLRSLGYTASDAADGSAGLAACEAAPQPYDLLLTDVVMPGLLNGKALANEVARRWPQTKIVFMSGFTEISSMRHNRLEEGSVLLSKPFRKRDLARVVRLALDGTPARAG